MPNCLRCGKHVESERDLISSFCQECTDWVMENPEAAEREALDMEIARVELEVNKEESPAVEELGKLANAFQKAQSNLRTWLAEQGYEMTYREVAQLLDEMEERALKLSRENVLKYLRSR